MSRQCAILVGVPAAATAAPPGAASWGTMSLLRSCRIQYKCASTKMSRLRRCPNRPRSSDRCWQALFMAFRLLNAFLWLCLIETNRPTGRPMQKKNRSILIPLIGFVAGFLVVMVTVPGSDGTPPGTGVRNRVGRGFIYLMQNLGLLPTDRCIHSCRNACVANLKMIDAAKATWALENKKTISDIPASTDLYGTNAYIRDEPKCPLGGKYAIGSVQQKPRCSVPGHTL